MKITRKMAFGTAAGVAAALSLAACSSSAGTTDGSSAGATDAAAADPVKMCVLVADVTSSEALSFRDYYTDYIAGNFPVEFVYSDELADAEAEKTAMEGFIANNCEAVISFASADRPTQLDMAEDAGIYYAVATGALSEEEYETFKDYEYYVGAIGPDAMTEYQAGYDMVKHFTAEGDTEFGIFGGGVPYYLEMHIYRAAGMLAALAEDPTTSYGGATEMGDILGKIYQDGTIKIADFESDVYTLSGYLETWDFDAAWQASMADMIAAGPDAILAVGTGNAILGAAVDGTGIQIGDIDAYTEDNLVAMENGTLGFLAGKFTSINGPIFAATLSAVQGEPYRTAEGSAFALSQGYWEATTAEEFQEIVDADNVDAPVYDVDALSPFVASGASYDEFADFVSKYTFADLVG
ncbi:hypothetical protein QQX10_01600 [Demequina sp. SYSU T00039]|uniref:Sugar ABC transporter substrate-binding protein n=1 Tax=Demequina lignilytica TaxID=3051663 RepID=A0AAW7M0V6_9MICO|nr:MULTISPECIES: hypothetical protein [unclassified Demequina]MDN4486854.1 hypothetical protein [Demequina sp. SYSU T00039]MDN4489538.1 hypothetical protein [Demequina sp. SYSU T00068]